MKQTSTYIAYLLLSALLIGVIVGCAKQASPEGGPYDMIPPKLIRSIPSNEAINIVSKKIKLRFNENVKVEKQNEKVFFSPPQQTPPRILHGTGKTITIIYEDDLKPNTTYTINFTDAIVDLNEGNPLEGFVFAFSTGSSIDTLQIRGKVIDAQSLAPVPDILVGVHHDGSDTLFQKRPLLRVAQTDNEGSFVISHLAPGAYRLFALNDLDHSFSYSQRSEGFAISEQLVTATPPLHKPEAPQELDKGIEKVSTDTLSQQEVDTLTAGVPAISSIDSTKIEGDSVSVEFEDRESNLLLYSVDLPKKQFLQKSSRPDSLRLVFTFNTPIEELPQVSLLHPDIEQKQLSLLQLNTERKEITYWLGDPSVYQRDTLEVQINYAATDSLEQVYTQIDTLSLAHRKKERRSRPSLKKSKASASTPTGDSIRLDSTKTLLRLVSVEQKKLERWYKGSTQDTVQIFITEPIAQVDSTKVHLYSVKDSIETPEPFTLGSVPYDPCALHLLTNYQYGTNYKLVVDSTAIQSIYGAMSRKGEILFSVESEEKFGALQFTFPELPQGGDLYIDLLNEKNEILITFPLKDSTLYINNLPPANYFARMWVDLNNNALWDPASYPSRKAEPVYFYPQALSVQAKFTSEETWLFNKLPLQKQRPSGLQSPFKESKSSQQGGSKKNLNEEYIQRMRERYGDKWNPSNRDRKILGLPSRAEEKAQREAEKKEHKKGEPSKEEKPTESKK